MLWMGVGTVLSLRPASVPGASFRASMDLLPWLGLGLLLIAAMLFGLNYQQREQGGRLVGWAAKGAAVGAVLYALGHAIRFFLKGAWEPAVPLGFLTFIFCLLLVGVATRRAGVFPKWFGSALLIAAIFLLFFNDQFVTAWLSVPFGVTWVVLGAVLLRGGARLPAAA